MKRMKKYRLLFLLFIVFSFAIIQGSREKDKAVIDVEEAICNLDHFREYTLESEVVSNGDQQRITLSEKSRNIVITILYSYEEDKDYTMSLSKDNGILDESDLNDFSLLTIAISDRYLTEESLHNFLCSPNIYEEVGEKGSILRTKWIGLSYYLGYSEVPNRSCLLFFNAFLKEEGQKQREIRIV